MVAHKRSLLQRAFVTDDRRPNVFWRILCYICSFFVLDVVAEILAELVVALLRWPQTIVQPVSVLFTIPAIFGFTYFFRLCVDRRSWRGIALTPLTRGPQLLLLGMLLGSIMPGLIFVIEYALGWIQIAGTELDSSGLVGSLSLVLLGLVFAIATGFIEELAFRGYVFQNLGRNLPLWLAILITGILFGLLHFTQPGFDVVLILQAVVVSALWVFCRLGTGTLWLAIGWHAAWNWMEDSVIGFSSADTPAYGHALLHLKLLRPGWITLPEHGPVGFLIQLLGLVVLVLWVQRGKRRWDMQSRLDDEGQMQVTKVQTNLGDLSSTK
ncbi:MAG TPA: type II CAAX endopeptidase family protein [Ktedonosporobacter sp.]|nr:type II CAAX endopeptidase family protein [Ktedonosporobacter sp.]